MLIAQLSDTHIMAPGEKTCGVAEMDAHLRRCVESINAVLPKPDIVLVTGDVTHKFKEEEAQHAAVILSQLEMPLFIVPGNHDDRQVLSRVFGPEICPLSDEGYVDYVIDAYPVRIIALDTLHVGHAGGHISAARLDWLRAQLDDATEQPTVIMAHHPPLDIGVPETYEDGFSGAGDLGQLIAQYPNIERVLCGHVHLHTNSRWRGTVVTTAPSIGMQLTLDLSGTDASRFFLSDPAYLLHHWTADQALITHPIQVTDLDGPFHFT
ncbi:MAG TPA: phosphodiesterase [Octadecabacter sp.]|nr:phosphodiesterase [Octadecabacter sp.]